MPITPTLSQVALIGSGVVVAALAVWFLFRTRAAGRRLRFQGQELPLGSLTFPTRVCIGFVGMLAGYHLIVWAFPVSLTSVQLSRGLWWVWGLLGIGACVLSVVIDRMEQRSDSAANSPPS